jgi:hypothetical protein
MEKLTKISITYVNKFKISANKIFAAVLIAVDTYKTAMSVHLVSQQ